MARGFVSISTAIRKRPVELLREQEADAPGSESDRPALRVRYEPTTPSLVEIGPDGEGECHSLTEPETWIGRDAGACAIVVDHPCVNRKHAVIKIRKNGRWVIENARSRDGTWLRIHEIELGRGAQFQCGEQRFLIRVV